MKLPIAAVSALALMMAGSVIAQQTTPGGAAGAATGAQSTQQRGTTASPGAGQTQSGAGPGQMMSGATSYRFRVSDIIGEEIENAQGDEVGEIDDLIVTEDNNMLYAIVSVGGFLGIGDRLVAIPYRDLQVSHKGDDTVITYDITKDQLKARPAFSYRQGETRWRDNKEREARWSDRKAAEGANRDTSTGMPSASPTSGGAHGSGPGGAPSSSGSSVNPPARQ